MTRRVPSEKLVVDANIVVTAIIGRVGPCNLLLIGTSRVLITTPKTVQDVKRILSDARFAGSDNENAANAVLRIIDVEPQDSFDESLGDAALCLTDAVASANGSTADDHILALAWAADADIWSHDRDFGGTGWPSWSTRNLRRALDL